MDIRFINKKNEIINASRLSIKRMRDSLIGINERNEVVLIEEYENEEEAGKVLKYIGGRIMEMSTYGNNIVIDLRKE